LARMNMILHGVHYRQFDIQQEDTLEEPKHLDKRFEAVVANPPFSSQWKGEKNPLFQSDERFSQFGKLAPSSKADFAFVQHMIYQLGDNGTLACVLPHGVLFRGASEGKIREYLIKELNYVDAIIGLPANIFYGTSIPTCILVVKKCRTADDNILFIDASQHFEKQGNQNVLTDSHVEKIIETFRLRKEEEKYSHLATLQEVLENDYNLNIPRYVNSFEEEEQIEINQIAKELRELDKSTEEIDKKLSDFCKELNIEIPF